MKGKVRESSINEAFDISLYYRNKIRALKLGNLAISEIKYQITILEKALHALDKLDKLDVESYPSLVHYINSERNYVTDFLKLRKSEIEKIEN